MALTVPLDVCMERLSLKIRALRGAGQASGIAAPPPVPRFYFATAAGDQQQLQAFVQTAAWLLQLCGRKQQQLLSLQTLPSPQALQLLVGEARATLSQPPEAQPGELQQGHGQAVCTLLDQLAEKAMQQLKFQWQSPQPSSTRIEQAQRYLHLEVTAEPYTEEDAEQQMQASDAALLEEADRLEQQGMFELQLDEGDSTWQLDLMLLKEDTAKLQSLASEALQAMNTLQQEVAEDLQALRAHEDHLNEHCRPQLAELQALNQHLEALKQEEATQQLACQQAQETAQQLNQEVQQKKKQLQVLTSKVQDTQALTRMQEAVGKLDGELSDMAVHIGLLQHHMHSLQAPPATHSPVGIAA
ncbi:hypothetical protein WJX73_001003 [Symbiochloris irregularis]|uniref:Uncharacterized protein n=1 Tax=Symbiochloris irregularis TaxID=706552 RepID=A0AAW1PSW3_9CHLO